MQNSQDAINPHLLLHTKAGPEPPDSHNYYRIGQPQQQHILGEASYLHYAPQPQPQPPSLTPPSRSSNGRASIEARYRALMRNMLMYQQMRIRATTHTPYVEASRPQQQQQQQEETTTTTTTLFSSFSLPPHHHHQHLEYGIIPPSFDLPPPAEQPVMLDAAVSQVEIVAAPSRAATPSLQDRYHHQQQQARAEDPFECANACDEAAAAAAAVPTAPHGRPPKPSRISRRAPGGGGGGGGGRRAKPARGGGEPEDGSSSRTSSSRISRSKPRSKPRPRPKPIAITSAVQFALEELTTTSSSSFSSPSSRLVQQQHHHHHHDPTADRSSLPATEPSGEAEAVCRNRGDEDDDNNDNEADADADDDDEHGMTLDYDDADDDDDMEDLHARATRDLVLECFVSSMSDDGLG
ncbi:hypothetical protein F4809DRAFT_327285 [Biscogniauxia mediterranea]|nr:hypothetical protein F4809DRAFT_327285 [Biscogniauxia mediterranea]